MVVTTSTASRVHYPINYTTIAHKENQSIVIFSTNYILQCSFAVVRNIFSRTIQNREMITFCDNDSTKRFSNSLLLLNLIFLNLRYVNFPRWHSTLNNSTKLFSKLRRNTFSLQPVSKFIPSSTDIFQSSFLPPRLPFPASYTPFPR